MSLLSCAFIDDRVTRHLSNNGLSLFGWFEFEGRAGLLIGNRGSAMWEHFVDTPEYRDGQADPMNRWTRRILLHSLDALGSHSKPDLFFPFDKPFLPFQRFAMQATGNLAGPLGLVIDPEYGLWQALRGAMLFDASELLNEVRATVKEEASNHPCNDCVEKPCLRACPVGAFGDSGLDVAACFSHLALGTEPRCMDLGCQARGACPVGQEHHYSSVQLKFHMKSYRGSPSRD